MRFNQTSALLRFLVLVLAAAHGMIPLRADEQTNPPATSLPASESFRTMRTGGMAPYTLHVNAVDMPLSRGTVLTARYEWDFGDSAASASPEAKYNTLVGWNAAHVYTQPGKYTVTFTLTEEGGAKRSVSKEFFVTPDTRRAIYVAENGSDSNDGATSNQPVRSIRRAVALARENTKILLRRGDTFDVSDRMEIKFRNVLIGAYAPSPLPSPAGRGSQNDDRPIIRYVGGLTYTPIFTTRDDVADFTVQDVTFDSKYTNHTEKTGMPDCIKPAGANTTVRNCVFLNVGYAINGNASPRGVMAQGNSCPLETGLRSYFAWVQGGDHVYLGNTVANSTREHCIRVGGADRVLIAYNDLANLDRRDKDKGNDKLDTAKGTMTIHAGNYVYVWRNTVGRGEILIGPLGKEDGKKNMAARWKWAVVEENRIGSFVYINHGTEHVACRNNLVKRNEWACFIVEGWDDTYQRGNGDITILNNTGINKTARGNFLRVTGKVDGITLANNLYIAPRLDLKDNFSAPVFVDDKNLSSFCAITNNLWPDLKGFDGVNYVKGLGGYLGKEKWLDSAPVKGDRFETLPVPATEPATRPDVGAVVRF